MQKIIKEFPILDHTIYANTAAYGIMYDSLLDWRQEHDLDYLIGGSDFKIKGLKLIHQVRETVGQFFKCKTANVALVQNFSLGLNLLLEGLDPKKRVLLLHEDYPSLNWPFEKRGFDSTYIHMAGNIEALILNSIQEQKIDVLAISIVQWLNGIKIDLDFLKRLKKEFPDLLIIADGTQYLGTEAFNFEDSAIDVLGASAYKWLLAGSGNGFFLFKDEAKHHFSLKTIGFNSVNGDFNKKNNFDFIYHFEPGHLDTLSFGSLKCSLDYLKKIGMDQITKVNKELRETALREFSKLNLLEEHVLGRLDHGNIFNIEGNQKLYDELRNNDIICSLRGGGIRLSFHFYNTTKNIAKVVDVIKKMK